LKRGNKVSLINPESKSKFNEIAFKTGYTRMSHEYNNLEKELSSDEWHVLGVIYRFTYLYGKAHARIKLKYMADKVISLRKAHKGIDDRGSHMKNTKKHIGNYLKDLERRGLIEISGNKTDSRGLIYHIPPELVGLTVPQSWLDEYYLESLLADMLAMPLAINPEVMMKEKIISNRKEKVKKGVTDVVMTSDWCPNDTSKKSTDVVMTPAEEFTGVVTTSHIYYSSLEGENRTFSNPGIYRDYSIRSGAANKPSPPGNQKEFPEEVVSKEELELFDKKFLSENSYSYVPSKLDKEFLREETFPLLGLLDDKSEDLKMIPTESLREESPSPSFPSKNDIQEMIPTESNSLSSPCKKSYLLETPESLSPDEISLDEYFALPTPRKPRKTFQKVKGIKLTLTPKESYCAVAKDKIINVIYDQLTYCSQE